MVLSDEQALEYIVRPYCDKELAELRKLCEEMRAYVTGKNIKKYMPALPQFERDELAREREAMLVSPAPVLNRIINPRNRIFSAKGGVNHFIIKSQEKEKEFRDYLDNITQGLSIDDWIKLVLIKRNDYDPNGIVLIEKGVNGRLYPCFKSIMSVRDRQLNGRTPEYLILRLCASEIDKLKSAGYLHKNTSSKSEIYRVIDDKTDRLFSKTKKLKEIPSFYAPKFPGRVSSNIFGDEDGIFHSPFDVVYEDIKQLLLWSSLYNVVFARQAFPKEWMHRFGCPTCEGAGVIDGLRCPECKGTRVLLSLKHSDVAIVDWGDENNKNIPNPPMGVTEAAVETLEALGDVLEIKEDKIYYGMWGMFRSDRSASGGNIQRDKGGGSSIEPTAYQAMLNSQPMVTQLVEDGKWYSDQKKFICDVCGTVLLGKVMYQGSSILCGDRYMIESPDATWDRYLKAVKAEAPMSELDSILVEYIENKYANNPLLYRKYMLLMGAEPFLHYTIEQVTEWDIPVVQKYEKIYFDEWKTSMSDWDFNMIADGYCDSESGEEHEEEGSELESGVYVEGGDSESDGLEKKNDPIKNLKDSLRAYTLLKIKDDGGLEKPRVMADGTLVPLNSIILPAPVVSGGGIPKK